MDLKYRKIIAKVKPLHRAIRSAMYNSGSEFYRKIYKERDYKSLFESLHDSQVGKRCFIIGNGPSLTVDDLEKLVDEDCFGTNEIHRIFQKTRWRPKYYLIMDRYSKSTSKQIKDLECKTVFLGDYYWRFNEVLREDAICLHQHQDLNGNSFRFSSDISKCIYNSPTVSFGAMQIAAYLGYKEIILLGFDHNYSFEFDKRGNVISTGTANAHFFKDDMPEDIIANICGMNKAYEAARAYCCENGISIKNATRGGKMEIFERINFDELTQKQMKIY